MLSIAGFLATIRLVICCATSCWDNQVYQNNPCYWIIEYFAFIMTGLSLGFSTQGLKIAFAILGGILTSLSFVINQYHMCSYTQRKERQIQNIIAQRDRYSNQASQLSSQLYSSRLQISQLQNDRNVLQQDLSRSRIQISQLQNERNGLQQDLRQSRIIYGRY